MITKVLLTAGALLAMSGSVTAKEYPERMEFSEFQPCTGTASFCRPQYLARGILDDGAPDRLQALLAANPAHPVTLALDSPGGSLKAGLLLGAAIRGAGLNTLVAGRYAAEEFVPGTFDTAITPVSEEVICFSACAYAFMGGVSRQLGEGGRIGVHQFYSLDGSGTEAGTQTTAAVVSQYMVAMGVDRDLLDLASFTEAQGMTELVLHDAQIYNLDNQAPPLQPWGLTALDDGTLALKVEQQKAGGDRRTTIALLASPDTPSSLLVIIGQHPLAIPADSRMVSQMTGEQTRPSICSGYSLCAEMLALSPWAYDSKKNWLSASFRVSLTDLVPVTTNAEPIRLDVGFPNMFFNEAPSVDVGRAGLRNGMLALLKAAK